MDDVDFTKTFADQFAPKFKTVDELAAAGRKKNKKPESILAWGYIPTKALLARYQLATAFSDAGISDLAEKILAPESEEIIARMARILKNGG